MATIEKKVVWGDLEDVEEKNFEPRIEVEEKVVKKEEKDLKSGKSKTIEELVQVTKRLFPVTKAVKQRKVMKKFGDIADLEHGKNKQGEVTLDTTLRIETQDSQDRFEIDIVHKIKGLNQDEIKQKKLEEKQKKLQQEKFAELNQDGEEVIAAKKAGGTDQLSQWAQKAMQEASQNATIKIENIVLDQDDSNEQNGDEQFKDFIANFIHKQQNKLKKSDKIKYNLKILRNKGSESYMGKAFLSFYDQNLATQIFEALSDYKYGNCLLDIKWAEARRDFERRDKKYRR